jgi:hypothetical protein
MTVQQTGNMWGELAKLWVVRGLEGESRISEEWKDIVASRHTVRVRQWLGAMAGLLLAFAGLAGIGVPVAQAGGAETLLDVILIGSVTGVGVMLVMALVGYLLRNRGTEAQVVTMALAATFVLAAVVLVALRMGEPEWWHTASAIAGVCVVVPSVAFTYNQAVDLVDPMGWVSAFERRMVPHLETLMMSEMQPPQVVERSLIPWRHANRRHTISARNGMDEVTEVPSVDDLNLADWLEEATRRGIGRRNWLVAGRARYLLPTTETRVTRPVYDRMVEMAADAGYLKRGTGDGDASEWVVEPPDAYEDWCTRMEQEWGDVLEWES